MRVIHSNKIRDIKFVKSILDEMREYIEQYEDAFGDLSENEEFDIDMQLAEIDEFIFGVQQINEKSIAEAAFRKFIYYDYISKEISFYQMLRSLKDYQGEQ